jgi:hypothetical protein
LIGSASEMTSSASASIAPARHINIKIGYFRRDHPGAAKLCAGEHAECVEYPVLAFAGIRSR